MCAVIHDVIMSLKHTHLLAVFIFYDCAMHYYYETSATHFSIVHHKGPLFWRYFPIWRCSKYHARIITWYLEFTVSVLIAGLIWWRFWVNRILYKCEVTILLMEGKRYFYLIMRSQSKDLPDVKQNKLCVYNDKNIVLSIDRPGLY